MILFFSNSDQIVGKLGVANLNGSSFLSWKRNVKRALITKNKLGFIEGTLEKPLETNKDYNRWMRCDYMIICWLVNSMNEDIGENFTSIESSEQLWNGICERFDQFHGP